MLEELHVTDLALIEDVRVEFRPGLTVLTGETGAGKTVLVAALGLLLGERADPAVVRAGADEGLVEGRFVLAGEERVARRRISAEGRSRCYLDGEMATVAALAEVLGPSVDLHGQHDHQALLSPATHAAHLDRFVGEPAREALSAWASAWCCAVEAAGERGRLLEAMRDRAGRLESLRLQIQEIDSVAPRPDEDTEIEARLPKLRHGERLAEAASFAFAQLRGEGGASDAVAQAAAALRPVLGLDPVLDSLAEALDDASVALDDVGTRIRDYGEGVDYDPAGLNDAEARAAALTVLKRKYGPALADVLQTRASAVATLDELESGEDAVRHADQRVAEAEELLAKAATLLGSVRADAAPGFVGRLADAARELSMPRASFDVAMVELPRAAWTADGHQRVEFLFTSDSGEPLRPLARIASGGEVSRVMLALKTVLGEADVVPVLVFDEVDAGIGGATAVAVGRQLAALARRHQVLVVTHLAQVAAFADHHLVVEKGTSEGRAVTRVREAEGDARVAEIARMLSGSDSATGLAHARELLADVAGKSV
jgi:DNA repair protein RecN (Recombination protein N)